MKRSNFLKLAMAAVSGLSLPFASFAGRRAKTSLTSGQKPEAQRAGKGFFVAAGKDRSDKSISLFEGDSFYAKVSTADTNGDIYMFESAQNIEVRKAHGFEPVGPPLTYLKQ